ncbi:hypothetical protein Tco_0939445 [Tanacetum coccineum]|uniref:Uncharacterized protein n=1 Tax=Tanacetum coccineum TaxID=301880 RepID=A0ABQ5DKM8_9ASTR
MLRTNSQAKIVSEEQLVPHANRLVIKKSNQRVASDSHITNTMMRFVVEILRHHKLYNPVSLNATMPPPDPNNTYTKPPLEIQILKFIKTLGYDEDPETKMTVVSKMVATRLHQPWRAILSVLNRCLTGKDSSWDTVRLPILQILWGIIHSANLDFTSLFGINSSDKQLKDHPDHQRCLSCCVLASPSLSLTTFFHSTRVFLTDQTLSCTVHKMIIS